ncbi:MAG: TonB-dependent receptor [Chitinophagaceae bacterium]
MKNLWRTFIALLFCISAKAQITIQGNVTDKQKKTLINATIILELNNKKFTTLANENGFFEFDKIPSNNEIKIIVEHVGKQNFEQIIQPNNQNIFLNISLNDLSYFLEPLEVTSVRASDKAPFTKTNLTKNEIAKTNVGQDLPFILNQTPSVYVSSDAGNGVGYTYMHIRGTDATRINVTLNGIPYNDAESEQTYFVDLPDFSSSVNSIQIQRGVGTSTNGSGAFGATINLSTNEFIDTSYAEINNSYGSFNTWKNTLKVGSGLINNHFTIDARLSRITSDGYIDRATSNLQSFYISAAYINKKTSLRLNVLSGKEKTYQAWYGVPQDSLLTHRTFNPAGTEKPGAPYDNETDNYWQSHYQLFFNQSLNKNLSFNLATFLTRGYGYYEEYKAAQPFADYGLSSVVIGNDTISTTDLVRQLWLDNYFYGQIFSLQYKTKKDEFTLGGSWSIYNGKHYGKLVWGEIGVPKDDEYYNFPAKKLDDNIYAKWLHQLNKNWNLFGDMQYRFVKHTMNGFEDNPDLFISRKFNFINPKAGINYFNNGFNFYFSYAMANKEPNRDDFEASLLQQPKQETLYDFELGINKKKSLFNYGTTIYYMLYKDQLVLTGKLNDVGNYTRVNVPNSYRLGLELQGGVTFNKWLNANANVTFSKNKIKNFTEYLDDYDDGKQVSVEHQNTDISFSPSIIVNGSLNFLPIKNLELNFISKYVSKQYLDNTQNINRSLNDFYTQDVRAVYTIKHIIFKEWNIIAQINNVFNRKYEPNGSTYPYIYNNEVVNDNYYYPMAGTNFMVAVNVKL